MAEPHQVPGGPLRPLRLFAPLMALLAPLFVFGAVVLAISSFAAERETVASGSAAGLVLRGEPSRELALYGANADGSPPEGQVRCTLPPSSEGRVFTGFRTGSAVVDGQELTAIGSVEGRWKDGETLTCQGVDQVAALAGQGQAARLGMAGMSFALALGTAAFAVIGFRSRAGVRSRTGPVARW